MKIELFNKYKSLKENEVIKICQNENDPECEYAKEYMYKKYQKFLKSYVYGTIGRGGQGGGHKIQGNSPSVKDDLYSSVTCAFMHAIRKYETDKSDKASFKTYLRYWMRDYVQKEIRSMNGLIVIDNRIWRKFLKYCSESIKNGEQLSTAKESDLKKIAENIGCDVAELVDIINTNYMSKVSSISSPDGDGGELCVYETLSREDLEDDGEMNYKALWENVEEVVKRALLETDSIPKINSKVKEFLLYNGAPENTDFSSFFSSRVYHDMILTLKECPQR